MFGESIARHEWWRVARSKTCHLPQNPMIKKINHVAIIVSEMDESMKFWRDALGLSVSHTAHVPEQDVNVAFLPVGESDIELLESVNEESGVARYLQKRGAGIHHICLEVDDIEAMLGRLKNAGIPLIDETPKIDADGKKLAFVHPKGTGGVLVELYELNNKDVSEIGGAD